MCVDLAENPVPAGLCTELGHFRLLLKPFDLAVDRAAHLGEVICCQVLLVLLERGLRLVRVLGRLSAQNVGVHAAAGLLAIRGKKLWRPTVSLALQFKDAVYLHPRLVDCSRVVEFQGSIVLRSSNGACVDTILVNLLLLELVRRPTAFKLAALVGQDAPSDLTLLWCARIIKNALGVGIPFLQAVLRDTQCVCALLGHNPCFRVERESVGLLSRLAVGVDGKGLLGLLHLALVHIGQVTGQAGKSARQARSINGCLGDARSTYDFRRHAAHLDLWDSCGHAQPLLYML
ncbi:hypothetical protein D3C79_661380 [compost metagenome]